MILKADGIVGNHKGLPLRQRKSIRLKDYDYSQAGLYFMTICTQNRLHLFGEIVNDNMVFNDAGNMIEKLWREIPNHFKNTRLHEYIIMPNHIHGIIEISSTCKTIGNIVGAFKSLTTNEYIKMVKQNILPSFDKRIWQHNYWEHIIRDEHEHTHIAQYMMDNPQTWAMDQLNVGGKPL
ncbi:MAG: transposase [Zetaproteobacteria bacterium]|nr:transposase [Zetaproteobacteria bacterium]